MSNGVTVLWIAISLLFTTAVLFSFITPVWFENKELTRTDGNSTGLRNVSFGPLRFCTRRQLKNSPLVECRFYNSLIDIPSTTWILCGVVYTLGCCLLLTALMCAIVGCCMKEDTWERVRLGAAYLQLFGVVFISLALLFFPLGLSSSFVHSICGPNSDMYRSGECQIAWGYVLSIMSSALLIFSPILARYSIEKTDNSAHLYATDYRPNKMSTAV
eukprot:gene13756-15195_t